MKVVFHGLLPPYVYTCDDALPNRLYLFVCLFMAAKTENSLSPRSWSFLASAWDRLYLWGGYGDTEPNTVHIYSVNTETWMREFTKGPPPTCWIEEWWLLSSKSTHLPLWWL